MENAKVIQVIQTKSTRGTGTSADPIRVVVSYWDFEGNLIAEIDDIDRDKYLSEKGSLNEELVLLLNKLLPKQTEEVIRAIKSEIPIMLINDIANETETVLALHKALKNAGAIMVPPCIKDYKKENVSFLSIYLNVKED